ncbi:hypothetical protein AC249_AIPGENE27499 [Exaiptasia diaphana]|nr:hypothetical protein AC249_AIPGENE27499 [Exaiptasia diaphana]
MANLPPPPAAQQDHDQHDDQHDDRADAQAAGVQAAGAQAVGAQAAGVQAVGAQAAGVQAAGSQAAGVQAPQYEAPGAVGEADNRIRALEEKINALERLRTSESSRTSLAALRRHISRPAEMFDRHEALQLIQSLVRLARNENHAKAGRRIHGGGRRDQDESRRPN